MAPFRHHKNSRARGDLGAGVLKVPQVPVEQRQLAWLITTRSRVRIPSGQPISEAADVPMKPCARPGCQWLVSLGVSYCPKHARGEAEDRWARADAARTSEVWRRWYKLKRWKHPRDGVRVKILDRDGWRCQWPGCGCILIPGRTDPSSAVVDHRMPHRGDPALFWNEQNLWSLCKRHHDVHKAREEARA